jgi:hypothetical protein
MSMMNMAVAMRTLGGLAAFGVVGLGLACGQAPQSEDSAIDPPAAARPAAQQGEPERIDVSRLGPQVGEIVPDFSLPDQTGRTRTLQSIMGPRGAMLVFVRSANW